MKRILFLLFAINFLYSNAQNQPKEWNFDFENNSTSSDLPSGWIKWGTYDLVKDTQTFFSGKQAVLINSGDSAGTFGSIAYKIPAKYKGKSITLEGYMKIENVQNGAAGLIMRIDKDGQVLEFNNMSNQKIQGTKDWTKYSITLRYHENADFIYVGGILLGKGKAWYDKFTVKIDGKEIQKLAEVERVPTKIELDNEFDESSSINLTNLSNSQIENLYLLGKVWGFVKYHHPEIAKGNINWDYELFRIMKKIDAPDFKNELVQWIGKLGEFKSNQDEVLPTDNVKLMPTTNWIKDKAFCSEDLSSILIKLNTTQIDKNHFVDFYHGVKNPNFENELAYSKMKWDDKGYRLLSLFRYWNIIEYYFPNKYLIDKNWDSVLKEFIPKIIEGNDELSYKLTLVELIGNIQDTHANVWGRDDALLRFFGEKTVPVQIKYIENKFVVVKLYNEFKPNQKLKVGDVILKVNGLDVKDYVAKNKKYFPASNEPTQYRNISKKLLLTNNEKLSVTYQSGNEVFTEDFETIDDKYWTDTTPASKELTNEIGYIYPASLKKGEINDIMKSFENKKGIVLDFRCYPSDFILFSLGKLLMPESKDFVKFSNSSVDHPGLFEYTKTTDVGSRNSNYYKGKVVILINEETQSSAEYHVMALRLAPKATVLGSTTAGADGNVSRLFLPGSVMTMISGIGVYYPDGTETQRIGIVPDLKMEPTVEGIKAGKDELLEKAIAIINQ
ncbi:MAG: peptidase S41 [Flavobacteriales bacterium]|nr:peptidase S41 [Flavobacteriales bacterium]